jgi:hypothetical protein
MGFITKISYTGPNNGFDTMEVNEAETREMADKWRNSRIEYYYKTFVKTYDFENPIYNKYIKDLINDLINDVEDQSHEKYYFIGQTIKFSLLLQKSNLSITEYETAHKKSWFAISFYSK